MSSKCTSPHVDEDFIKSPHGWDVADIRRYMLIFGPLSSLFDFVSFALLLSGLKASQQAFHSGWFIESVLSAALVVFAVWTYLPFVESRSRRTMLVITELGCPGSLGFTIYSAGSNARFYTITPHIPGHDLDHRCDLLHRGRVHQTLVLPSGAQSWLTRTDCWHLLKPALVLSASPAISRFGPVQVAEGGEA